MSGAMGGSHGAGGGGVAVPPPFGLLPRGDQQTLLRLMSDNNYQNSKLGASFTPSQQLESCSFWRWASAWLQQPLPAVMLTGMYLRTEADQEWARLHQERRRQQQEWSQRHRRGQPAAAASIAAQVAAAPAADEVANVQQPAAPAEDDAAGVQQPAALAEDEAAGVQQPAAPAPDDAAGVQQPAAPAPDDAAEQAAPEAVPAAQAAAPPPTKSLVLGDPKSGAKLEGSDVLRLIFQMVPLKDRLGALSLVCRASRDLARELGVAGPWWLADVQEEKTSGLRKILRSVKAATLQHAPGLRLSAVIMRVPAKHRLGKRQWQRHGLDALALWPGQAQLRLLLKDEGTLDNWRLSSLTQLRTLRHLSLVRVERVPGVLSKLTQLKTLAWDGEFRGQLSSLNAALAPLRRLTPLYWHDRETKEGKPQWSELDDRYPPLVFEWRCFVDLPPLAGVTALTELCLAGNVDLPPDFRQLGQLRRLTVHLERHPDQAPLPWGSEPLAGLTSLTRVEMFGGFGADLLPDPAVLASAPRLTELHAPSYDNVIDQQFSQQLAAWRAQLAALRPDLRITF